MLYLYEREKKGKQERREEGRGKGRQKEIKKIIVSNIYSIFLYYLYISYFLQSSYSVCIICMHMQIYWNVGA